MANEIPYEVVHRERFRQSRAWLASLPAKRVIEVGGAGVFTPSLHAQYGESAVTSTDFDLRFQKHWDRYLDPFDLAVCMEVLEHIGDPIISKSTVEEVAQFTGTGVMNMLRGIYSKLIPGSALFLTTPNGSNVDVIRRALRGYTPIQYYPHVREYGFNDTIDMVKAAGFTIEKTLNVDCYTHVKTTGEQTEKALIRQLLRGRFPMVDYGETLFLVARKHVDSR
jgi:hypothetical protein